MQLKSAGFRAIELDPRSLSGSESHHYEQEVTWAGFIQSIHDLDHSQPAYARQVRVEAAIGAFNVIRKIDFILVLWDNEIPKLRIIECKASRRDRTYHRIQVALYRMIIQRLMQDAPLYCGEIAIDPQDIECVVARIDENTNVAQDILDLAALENLDQERDDIERLLAQNGRLMQIAESNIQDLEYQINEKCNTCVFNVYCLPDSGIRHRLELLGIEPSVVRALNDAGISDIDRLADLDLEGMVADRIRRQPGFSENLEILRRKARTRLRTLRR